MMREIQEAIYALHQRCTEMGAVPDQVELFLCEDGETVAAYAYFPDGRDTCARPVYFPLPENFDRARYEEMFSDYIMPPAGCAVH